MSERDLFLAALDIEDVGARARFLAEKCSGDPERLKRLEHLLLAKSAADSFLEAPAGGQAGIANTMTAAGPDSPASADFPRHEEHAGAILAGKYALVEVIGEGGMGTVWRAKQTEPVKRFVAVKLIKAGMDSKTVLARFEAERQALAMMDHPNIAKVLDAGLVEAHGQPSVGAGRPFFVMELVKGTPITEYSDKCKLTPQQRLELFVQACQAIQHAHQKGIIHRDIKPSNVLVALYDDKPVVKVIDFGVAKATCGTLTEATIDTGFGGVVGTPQYMSPEQATFNNLDIDTRSDVYALGVLLYELLVGSPPFSDAELKKKGLMEILRVVREEEPPRPSTKLSTADALPSVSANRGTEPRKLTGLLRNELDWIVMKALEKDRTRRYETANGFAADVQRYLAGEPVVAHPPSMGYRLKKFVRRNKGQVIAASLVLLALVGGVVGTSIGMVQARRANAALADKNAELAEEQAKVQARFELAQKAIGTFHTGVSEDALLKNEQFKELRTKLLKEAAGFYGDLEKLLEGQADPKSRKLLAEGYFQLGGLTRSIGDQPEALAVHRKALALRRVLAAESGADVETRLAVAISLREVGDLLDATGDMAEAIRAFEEMRDVGLALEAESPTGAALEQAAKAYIAVGWRYLRTGRPAEAQASYDKALAGYQKLTNAHPANDQFRVGLAQAYYNLGALLTNTGRTVEALAANERGLAIRQKLAGDNPSVVKYQTSLAWSLIDIGLLLDWLGRPAEGLAASQKALAVRQKLVDAQPAVNQLQSDLADGHCLIGNLLRKTGQPEGALDAYRKALAIQQRLADANPAVTNFQAQLAKTLRELGILLQINGQPAEAIAALEKATVALRKLSDANPTVTTFPQELSRTEASLGWYLFQMGRPVEGLAAQHQALDRLQKLADANPTMVIIRADLAIRQNTLGLMLAQSGRPAEALAAYEKARAIRQEMSDAYPDVPDYRSYLATSHNNIGRLHAHEGRFPEAFAAFDAGLALRQKLADANPTVTTYTSHLGYSYAFRGWARVRAGQPKEAAVDLRKALELFARDGAPVLETRFERTRVLAVLAGLGGDAKSGVTAAEAKTFADQSVAALADAIKAGWANHTELKEADFDAIRDRADLKKMLAELEKRFPAKQEELPPKAPKK